MVKILNMPRVIKSVVIELSAELRMIEYIVKMAINRGRPAKSMPKSIRKSMPFLAGKVASN